MAKVQCSQCGAELDMVKWSQDWKNWKLYLFLLPLCAIPLLPLWFIHIPDNSKHNWRSDLVLEISSKQKVDIDPDSDIRFYDPKYIVTGKVTNQGNTNWDNIQLQVEFFDEQKNLICEIDHSLSNDLEPKQKEEFYVEITNISQQQVEQATDVKVRIVNAFNP